ncbi:hypothetical protein ACFX13_041721 [Malus domestica]
MPLGFFSATSKQNTGISRLKNGKDTHRKRKTGESIDILFPVVPVELNHKQLGFVANEFLGYNSAVVVLEDAGGLSEVSKLLIKMIWEPKTPQPGQWQRFLSRMEAKSYSKGN